MSARSDRLAAWMAACVVFMARHAVAVVVFYAIAIGGLGAYAATHLSMDTDNANLISAEVPWRRDHIAYQQAFPVYTDNLVVVIDGQTPEIAGEAAQRLAAAMRREPQLFTEVYLPGGEEFFARNGLLYLPPDALEQLAERLNQLQPFLGSLAAQPGLTKLISLLGQAMDPGAPLQMDLTPVFRELDAAFTASREQRFHRMSWQSLTGAGALAMGPTTQRFIIALPKLAYGEMLPAARPMQRVRDLAAALQIDAAHGLRVRETGEAAIEQDELRSVADGAVWGMIASLLQVAALLYFGLRSWRLLAAALLSLVAGLVGTAAFAAAAVGTLNLISVAFAVLSIGLGIDYAVHLGLRYREALAGEEAPGGVAAARGEPRIFTALRVAAADVGMALLLCAATTATGFFAFIPTSFDGVGELGLIAGTGMGICLVVSLTLLPALIALMRIDTPGPKARMRMAPHFGARGRHAVRIVSLGVALGAIALLPSLRFDSSTLALGDAQAESVTTFRELLQGGESPLSLVTMRSDAASARALAQQLAALPEVKRAITIDDWVPKDQPAKLAIIADLQLTMALAPPAAPPPETPAQLRDSLRQLRTALAAQGDGGDAAAAQRLAASLAGWQRWFDALPAESQLAALAALRESLLAGLAPTIDALMQSLQAQPFTRDDLPESVKRRWIGRDGSFRIEAFPAGDLNDPAALERFVRSAQTVAPHITGAPVLEVEAGKTVSQAFIDAFVYATVFIVLLLLLLLRSLIDTARVLAPLALTALLLCGASVLFDTPFNFANVIALPLLLGIGVDNAIHVVRRLKETGADDPSFLTSSTARAVVLSALTTLASFGTLAFSKHAGTASMGRMLVFGMIAIQATTLVVIPALFRGAPAVRARDGDQHAD